MVVSLYVILQARKYLSEWSLTAVQWSITSNVFHDIQEAASQNNGHCDVNAADLKALIDDTCQYVIKFNYSWWYKDVRSRNSRGKSDPASRDTRMVAGGFGFQNGFASNVYCTC